MLDLSKLSLIFKILIIGIVYIIIFYALKIMYKDIKQGGRRPRVKGNSLGLEVMDVGDGSNLKIGSIVPLGSTVSMGRREDNMVILTDPYASGHHARIYLKNGEYILEDLGSTNGTILNAERVGGRKVLKVGDEIRIGSFLFKVIG